MKLEKLILLLEIFTIENNSLIGKNYVSQIIEFPKF
jgi:hypothetical protein